MEKYDKVYNFTNENVTCLNQLYNLYNSKVLSVVGSGDQYFTSILGGAKQVDLYDVNSTSYLYFILKFYAIRELTFEEFYDLLVLRNFNNEIIYSKLENVLPIEVLKYYRFLITNSKNKNETPFRNDGINLFTKFNKKYYFKNDNTVIPYFQQDKYYELQNKLKQQSLPKFYKKNILELNPKQKYDVLFTSNIYFHTNLTVFDYVEELNKFDIPQIQAGYDWYGTDMDAFVYMGCLVNLVTPSSPKEYDSKKNFVYSIKK